MSNVTHYDVVIIGAGIAGSALAVALDGSDINVLLVDAGSLVSKPSLSTELHDFDARVSALTLQSRQWLGELGVWSDIESLSCEYFNRMYVWDGAGTSGNIEFHASEIGSDNLGSIVENRALVYSLQSKLQLSKNVKILDQASVENLKVCDAGYSFSLGDNTIETSLLVGADGARSFVREQLQFATKQWPYGHDAIVCTVATEHLHQSTAWQVFLPTGPVALLPLNSQDENLCSLVWSADSEYAQELMAMDDDDFAGALTKAFESVLGNVTACSKRFSFPLQQRHAVDYVKPSAALVGDAAHTIHPLAGQGINLGLKDVQVLSEEILRAKSRGQSLGDLQVLGRYQRRRKADNLAMMATMEGFKRLFERREPVIGLLRNQGMSVLSQLPWLKRQIIKHAVGK